MIATTSRAGEDLCRLRDEFLAMPTLALSAAQTARFLSICLDDAIRILATLEEEKLLIRTPSGLYRRSTDATGTDR